MFSLERLCEGAQSVAFFYNGRRWEVTRTSLSLDLDALDIQTCDNAYPQIRSHLAIMNDISKNVLLKLVLTDIEKHKHMPFTMIPINPCGEVQSGFNGVISLNAEYEVDIETYLSGDESNQEREI